MMSRELAFKERSKTLRKLIVTVANRVGGGHVGGSLSEIDVLNYIYFELESDPCNFTNSNRTRFLLSKGHGVLGLYACFQLKGIMKEDEIFEFMAEKSRLPGHSEHFHFKEIEYTTGSLGQGLSVAAGKAFFAKLKKENFVTYCMLGDGECNEGSVWEALMFISQHKLFNLVPIIDNNKFESLGKVSDILSIEPLADKLESFGFQVIEIDGHNFAQIDRAFTTKPMDKPIAIVANTIKGKGVSFMEHKAKWHYRGLDDDELVSAITEIDFS